MTEGPDTRHSAGLQQYSPQNASVSAARPVQSRQDHRGQPGSASPYTPAVIHIPVRKDIALDLTDNIGGCGLVTVFPGLGVDGRTVRALVPVGQTRRIVIRAARPGQYR